MKTYRGIETLPIKLTCRMKRTICDREYSPLTELFGCMEAAERYVAERVRWIEPGSVKIETGKFQRRVTY